MAEDEDVAVMVAVTNCAPELAKTYLSLCDGDAQAAIALFFDQGGADLGATSAPPAPSRPTPGNADDPITIDDDDDIPQDREASHTIGFDADAEMARRMQEEMYGGAGGEDEVRAPIARQAETLLGPGADYDMGGPPISDAVQQRMMELQSRRGRGEYFKTQEAGLLLTMLGFRPGIFNQQPTSSIWQSGEPDRDALAEATAGASEASSKSNTLARLFQPPWDLMYKESWEHAREDGKEGKKWLLVNIQDGSVFDCQILNRDLWKNPSVVETVKENFIFLQYAKEDPRAGQYLQYYFPQNADSNMYPHIAIVDPRTGEQVKLWSREVPKPADFLMQLHEFLDRYSLNSNARNPVAKRKSEAKKEKTFDEMTEEEQLEKALQESMATSGGGGLRPPVVEDPDDLTRSIGDVRDMGETNGAEAPEPSPFSLIAADQPHAEPTLGPDVTRIQLRHPEGRLIRRFALSDPVRRIYEFLKAEPLPGKKGMDFELVSNAKNLIDSLDQTIEQAQLKNGTVMVEFLEAEE
jgi:UBX domain-containing protein 7